METGWGRVGDHEVYCCGARVLIKDGVVTVLSEPRVRSWPLRESLYGIREIDRASVQRALQEKMKTLGFCRDHRVFTSSLRVPYGISEILSTCMRLGALDCAVTVCEGAGTVITDTPLWGKKWARGSPAWCESGPSTGLSSTPS